jgi:hypothetical protein
MSLTSRLKTLIAHSIAKTDAMIGVNTDGRLVACHEDGDEFELGAVELPTASVAGQLVVWDGVEWTASSIDATAADSIDPARVDNAVLQGGAVSNSWTATPQVDSIGAGVAADPSYAALLQSSDDTSATYSLQAQNASGYVGLYVNGEGLVAFGGGPTAHRVWSAYESSGTGVLSANAASGAIISSVAGGLTLRSSGAETSVAIDAPVAGGTILSRVGTGYTEVHTVSESGVTVSNNLAAGTALDANVTALLQAADDTSGKYSLLARNASGYYHLYVGGNGEVKFGGSAAANAVWAASESSGSAVLSESTASGAVIQSTTGNMQVRTLGTATAVLIDAVSTGGEIYSRVGPGPTTIHTVAEAGVTVSNYLGVGVTAASPVRLSVVGSASTTGTYQFGSTNSNGYQHFFVGDDGVIGFGGSAAANAALYAWEDAGDSIIESQGAGAAYFKCGSSGTDVQVSTATTSGTATLRATGSSGTAFMQAGSSTPGYIAVHATANASLFSTTGSHGSGVKVLSWGNYDTRPTTNPTAAGIFWSERGALCERNPDGVKTFRNKDSVAHTDGAATVVCSVTLPDVDGYYVARGEVAGGTATGSDTMAAAVLAVVKVDSSTAAVSAVETTNIGGTGYVATIDSSGLAVRITVEAASGQYSVGTLTLTGMDLDITPA